MNALLDAILDMDRDNPARDSVVATLRARIAEAERDGDFLTALEAAGVDNWEGYSEACNALAEDDGL